MNEMEKIIEEMKRKLKEAKENEGKEKVLLIDWLDDSIQYITKK